MTFDEFIKKYDGKEVDTDGYYGGQCMDLMHQYIVDVLNLPLSLFAAPTAYQAYQNANDPHFDKIANSPTGVPEKETLYFGIRELGALDMLRYLYPGMLIILLHLIRTFQPVHFATNKPTRIKV